MLLGGQVKNSITDTTSSLGNATTCAQAGGIWHDQATPPAADAWGANNVGGIAGCYEK